jgi:quinol monooxygenase YgiN
MGDIRKKSMTTLRLYQLEASSGASDALEAALQQLAGQIGALPGCASVKLMCDREAAETFLFLEKWESKAACAEGSKLLDKAAFKPVMAAIGVPPVMRELDLL